MIRGFLSALCCFVAVAISAVGFGAPAHAAPSSARADVTVVRPLTLIKDEDLDFGSIVRGAGNGTVVVPPNGARTATGGAILVGTAFRPARFAGFGATLQTVQISMGANSITLNRVGGGATMSVDTWVIGSTPTAVLTTNPLVFTIASSNGIFNFPLGATLRMAANQASGTYTGTFNVILNYQ